MAKGAPKRVSKQISLRKNTSPTKRVFLDYASATPMRAEVKKVMRRFETDYFVNPSALYKEGIFVRKMIEESRKRIAEVLSAHPDEIIFTSSGTEADNLAIFGVVEAARQEIAKPHIIVSMFEHPAVLEAARKLEKQGIAVSYAAVDENGFVKPETIRSLLTKNTVLVSVMYANNEIGTIQDIRGIAREIRHFKKLKLSSTRNSQLTTRSYPYFHTDAGQALLFCDASVDRLGVDLMSLDAAKIYGPKGIGALFVRRNVSLSPQMVGGGQEMGRRSGTEFVPGIVGFATALSLASQEKEKEVLRLTKLRDVLWKKIEKIGRNIHLNGSLENRLPNNINVCLLNQDSEYLVLKLDARGFAISSSSSCRSLTENNASYVIRTLAKKHPCDTSSLRITLGRETTGDDVDRFVRALGDAVKNP